MSPVYLLEPGPSGRWDLVEVDRPAKPLISGALLASVALPAATRPAEPHPTHPGIETLA